MVDWFEKMSVQRWTPSKADTPNHWHGKGFEDPLFVRNFRPKSSIKPYGRVAEWFKAPVLKTGVPARVP
jgi:hypothetical protein